MNNERTETMTPAERFTAIANLRDTLETNYIQLGELLAEVKLSKAYLAKGYESFASFVTAEYSLGSALASRLIALYSLFACEMDIDFLRLQEIGLERLSLIRPLVASSDWAERDVWLQKAEELPITDLKAAIKAHKQELLASEPPDLKKVFIDQWKERFCTLFGCSFPEVLFKLALFYSHPLRQDNLTTEIFKSEIKDLQRQFESTLQEPTHE